MRTNDSFDLTDRKASDLGAESGTAGTLRRVVGDVGKVMPSPASAVHPLRICLVAPLFAPEYSGAGLRFQRYAEGLMQRGIVMEVVAPTPGAWRRGTSDPLAARHLPPPPDSLRVHRVPVRTGTPRWLTRYKYEGALLRRCQNEDTRPHLVIWLQPSLQSIPRVVRLRARSIPSVYVQTMVKPLARKGVRARIKSLYQPLPLRFVDCIITGSSTMGASLSASGVDTRIEIIPHGVNLKRFRPPASSQEIRDLRARLGIKNPGGEVILFMGTIEERKGLDYLADAWNAVSTARPDATLLLVGPEGIGDREGHPPYGEELRRKFQETTAPDRVFFLGAVPDPEAYLRAADVFVFPSLREGMPNVVAEAFASGLACILTPFIGLPDDFGRAGSEYILAPHEAAALADAVCDLLADPDGRSELGRSARSWAEMNLDVERSIDRLADVCRDLVHSAR